MRTHEAVKERLYVSVRVNPKNIGLGGHSPGYLEKYESELAKLKDGYLKAYDEAVLKGEIEALQGQPGTITSDPEQSRLFYAHGLAVRDMNIAQALGGHGLIASENSTVYFHGALINYAFDEEVPVGGYVIDGGLDRDRVFDQLRELASH